MGIPFCALSNIVSTGGIAAECICTITLVINIQLAVANIAIGEDFQKIAYYTTGHIHPCIIDRGIHTADTVFPTINNLL